MRSQSTGSSHEVSAPSIRVTDEEATGGYADVHNGVMPSHSVGTSDETSIGIHRRSKEETENVHEDLGTEAFYKKSPVLLHHPSSSLGLQTASASRHANELEWKPPDDNPFVNPPLPSRVRSGDSSPENSLAQSGLRRSNTSVTSSITGGRASLASTVTSVPMEQSGSSATQEPQDARYALATVDNEVNVALNSEADDGLDDSFDGLADESLFVDNENADAVIENNERGIPPITPENVPPGHTRQQVLQYLMLKPKAPLERCICYGLQRDDLSRLVREHKHTSSKIRSMFKSNPSPLHYAALFGEVEAARQIIAIDAKLMDIKTHAMLFFTMGTPFHWAVLSRQAEAVDLFLKARPESLQTLAEAPDMSQDMYKWCTESTVSDEERDHGTYVPEQTTGTASSP